MIKDSIYQTYTVDCNEIFIMARTYPVLTAPVSMSYMSAPRLHQSTALPWPLLVKISGALQTIIFDYQNWLNNQASLLTEIETRKIKCNTCPVLWKFCTCWSYMRQSQTYMYSIVPQKVCVRPPSLMDSLHNPKSVNFTCPEKKNSKHI